MKITEKQIKKIAQGIARSSFMEIISITDIDRITASTAATDAANEFGRILRLTLTEHGVDVPQE